MKNRSVVFVLAVLLIATMACGNSTTPAPLPPQPQPTSLPAPTTAPQPTSPPPATGGDVPLTLYNNSGQDICFVYISPVTSDTWGE
ncbi:MAG: hypothetical protein JXD18_10335, partial [Anaerolineae bacterium]|nr:hypothetical protein [Anaerolineae bacterium]